MVLVPVLVLGAITGCCSRVACSCSSAGAGAGAGAGAVAGAGGGRSLVVVAPTGTCDAGDTVVVAVADGEA